MTDVWYRDYGDERSVSAGWITNDRIPCTFNEAIYAAGIEYSAILEIAWDYNGSMFTGEVIERGVDQLANYLLSFLQHYNQGL